jgi:hypothetical protein
MWALYGLDEVWKAIWSGVRLTFYRLLDAFQKKKHISLPKIHFS